MAHMHDKVFEVDFLIELLGYVPSEPTKVHMYVLI